MKIGIDARLWNETGVGRYIRNLVKNLILLDDKNNYVLFVLAKDYEDIKNQISQPKADLPLAESIKYQVPTLHPAKRNYEGQVSSKWKIVQADVRWHSVKEQTAFLKIVNKENVNLMHFPYFSLPILYKRPFVVTIHDLIIHHFPTGKASTLPMPLYKLKHLGYKAVLHQAVNKARKIIVPLQVVKDDVVKSFAISPDKIAVTYEGVDERVKGEGVRGKKAITLPFTLNASPFFLYVGNAYPHKNLDTLIKAFKSVSNMENQTLSIKNNHIKLVLVGKDDYFYKQLEKRLLAEKLSNIKILHNVSDQMLQGLYQHALGLIAPSIMEGFGLVPLEAMANKCLVIASDIPAHREVCKDAALYFDPNNVTELVKIMKRVCYYDLNHDINKKKLQGLERIKLFSWRRMAEQTFKIYEQFEK